MWPLLNFQDFILNPNRSHSWKEVNSSVYENNITAPLSEDTNEETGEKEPIRRPGDVTIGGIPSDHYRVFKSLSDNLSENPPKRVVNLSDLKYEEKVGALIEKIKSNVILKNYLREIVLRMPKIDLHLHLEGAIYPEELRRMAVERDLLCDLETHLFCEKQVDECRKNLVRAKDLDSSVWEKIFNEISFRNISKMDFSAGDKFFNSFSIRGSITDRIPFESQIKLLLENVKRLEVIYMEIMLELAKERVPEVFIASFPETLTKENLQEVHQQLIESGFIQSSMIVSKNLLEKYRENVLSDFEKDQDFIPPGFIIEIMRNKPLSDFFARTAAAMALIQEMDFPLVGITIDGPQYDTLALDMFKEQLKIIKFLRQIYDKPKVTFHVLEVNRKQVLPKQMFDELWLILSEVFPERVGHCTAIRETGDLSSLLIEMKKKDIAVEISFSTVKATTRTQDDKMPINLFEGAGIPCIICSDDSGVTHNDLGREIENAIKKHGKTYSFIKQSERAGLEYSFLSGESIYEKKNLTKSNLLSYQLKAPFIKMHENDWEVSEEAINLLNSPKGRAQYILEMRFMKYEKWCMEEFLPRLLSLHPDLFPSEAEQSISLEGEKEF